MFLAAWALGPQLPDRYQATVWANVNQQSILRSYGSYKKASLLSLYTFSYRFLGVAVISHNNPLDAFMQFGNDVRDESEFFFL